MDYSAVCDFFPDGFPILQALGTRVEQNPDIFPETAFYRLVLLCILAGSFGAGTHTCSRASVSITFIILKLIKSELIILLNRNIVEEYRTDGLVPLRERRQASVFLHMVLKLAQFDPVELLYIISKV